MSAHPNPLIAEMIQSIQMGTLWDNRHTLLQAISEGGESAQLVFQLGISCAQHQRLQDALIIFQTLNTANKGDTRIAYNLGLTYSLLGEHQHAYQAYKEGLQISPEDAELLINLGSTCNDLGNYSEAITALDKAVKIKPDIPEAWSNKGVALNNLGRHEESIQSYNKAIELYPSYAEAWSNRSVPLQSLGRLSESCESCDKALALKPDYAEAWSNKGVTLNELKQYEAAIAHYDKALALKPDYAEAWSNKGVTLNELKQYEAALAHYDKALALKPDYAEAWPNKGVTLNELKQYEAALAHYDKALALKPDMQWILGDIIHVMQKICQWPGLDQRYQRLNQLLLSAKRVIRPFQYLSLESDGHKQKQCAEIYARSLSAPRPQINSSKTQGVHDKIRIAYISADLHHHAVAFLCAELFELHNKNQFELFGFSLKKAPEGDEMRNRIKRAFDHFYDLEGKDEEAIAALSRSLGIDIAIDLGGYTGDARPGIFARHAAPIQVNYLGYPGTMGAEFMDYIIGDRVLIPPELRSFYSEKVVSLPNSYQANDSKRTISKKQFTRHELGLPDSGFIFCSFNNSYKILPQTFDSWIRILKTVEDSVLWLLEDNPLMAKNLSMEAQKRGIDPARLIYAKRMLPAEHLARHNLADLFLDTAPYNAHTTTSDALWMGLPVITLIGDSFASRVAASLLNAMNLPELITKTQQEYEELAIHLARNPETLKSLKKKIAAERETAPLFDTPLFTRHLEAAYIEMLKRSREGLAPDHISIT